MYSTPKRRLKSSTQNPNLKSRNILPKHSPSSSSSPTIITSLLVETEPPPNLLPTKSDLLKLFAVIAIATAVAVACKFLVGVFNRPSMPFCDSDVDYDDLTPDSCEPCPSNGRCYKGQLECIQGYKNYGKLCVEDGDINESATRLAEWAKNYLCVAYAQYKCYRTGEIWVSEDDLRSMLDKNELSFSPTVDNFKYMYAKERAMEYINKLFDAKTTSDGIKEFKCPDILGDGYRPMTCHARHWIAKNFLFLIPVWALLFGCTLSLLRIRRRWYLTNKAEQLYHQVCEILEENALMSKSVSDRQPWLVASRLRDHLLSPKERKDSLLWKMVEELVELDSRVERYPKLVKGESKVVWEWQVEGSLSSSRRRMEETSNEMSSFYKK